MKMTLKQFLKENNITITAAAKKLNISREHLTRIVNGYPAGKRNTLDIFAWSNGMVCPLQTLYGNKKPCRKTDICTIDFCVDYLKSI